MVSENVDEVNLEELQGEIDEVAELKLENSELRAELAVARAMEETYKRKWEKARYKLRAYKFWFPMLP